MLLTIFALVIVIYFGYLGIKMSRSLRKSQVLSAVTSPYNRLTVGSRQHLLILGDSTMYGAGASHAKYTFGGLLAVKYPAASIETLAVNGAKIQDLKMQLMRAKYKKYDLIVIGIGGNDVLRFSSFNKLREELASILEEVSNRADQVVLNHCVNLGNIGFFPSPINYLYDYRTRRLSNLFKSVSSTLPRVLYVNFYRPMSSDHYDKKTRGKFIASDSFHPSDYANGYFFNIIWEELQKKAAKT